MKIIRKTISALLLAGIGITSIQAQNNSPQAWTLRQCIDYAIEHNIEIRQSANSVEANKVSVNTSKWTRLPNLSGSASQNWSWGRTASPIDNSYSDINQYQLQLGNQCTYIYRFTVIQPIFTCQVGFKSRYRRFE